MNIVAVVQARTGSSRLPNKVLLPLMGRTILECVVRRVHSAKRVQKVVVATTVLPPDLAIVRLCADLGLSVYVGSSEDVLDRYYEVARLFKADHIVRVTADCPLIDPTVIDAVIKRHLSERADLTSNVIEETFPDGEDVEVVTFSALNRAWMKATKAFDREHVTTFLKAEDSGFRLCGIKRSPDLSRFRWTLDYPEDYVFVKRVYEKLGKNNACFGMGAVLKLLKSSPSLTAINGHIPRNGGHQCNILRGMSHGV